MVNESASFLFFPWLNRGITEVFTVIAGDFILFAEVVTEFPGVVTVFTEVFTNGAKVNLIFERK